MVSMNTSDIYLKSVEELKKSIVNLPLFEDKENESVKFLKMCIDVSVANNKSHTIRMLEEDIKRLDEMLENAKKYPMLNQGGDKNVDWNNGYASGLKEKKEKLQKDLTKIQSL